MKNKILIFLRRNYLKMKFKRSSKPIYINRHDRQLGLTTLLMKESLNKNIPILVKDNNHLSTMAHEMYKLGQLGFATPRSENYIGTQLLLNCRMTYRGQRYSTVLIDNALNEHDIYFFILEHLGQSIIYKGFITQLFN